MDVYNDQFDIVGSETFKEKMIRVGGEAFDDDAPLEDLYYGVTHYGWELVGEISSQDIDTLIRLGIALKS